MNSRSICKRIAPFIGAIVLCGCNGKPDCWESLGVCPPPEPGIMIDELKLTKSIWYEDSRVGQFSPVLCAEPMQSLCAISSSANEEMFIVMRGLSGMILLSPTAHRPIPLSFIGARNPENTEFFDLEGDGNFEVLDVSTQDAGPTVTIRLLDQTGQQLWSRESNSSPLAGDPSDLDALGLGLPLSSTCWNMNDYMGVNGQWVLGADMSASVRFESLQQPYSVEFAYSIIFEPTFFGCGTQWASRTIMKVMTAQGDLVYHEVIESPSGRASFAVIPSDKAGEEILLVGHGTQIVAYQPDQSD